MGQKELLMSTRYATRKAVSVTHANAVQSDEIQEKVNWLFSADLNTMAVAISDRSGIVKFDLGLGRRNPVLYRNEIEAFLDKADEIRRYLADHPTAKAAPLPKAQQREQSLILAKVQEAKAKQVTDMVKSMRDAGIGEDVIKLALTKLG
jgi:hypothetical protein